MAQPAITEFFSQRKRVSAFDVQSKSKVLLLEKRLSSKLDASDTSKEGVSDGDRGSVGPKLVYVSGGDTRKEIPANQTVIIHHAARPMTPDLKTRKRIPGSSRGKVSKHRKSIENVEKLPDIRKTFLKQSVKFELKGSLSPKKIKSDSLLCSSATLIGPSTGPVGDASCSQILDHDADLLERDETCIENNKTASSLASQLAPKSTVAPNEEKKEGSISVPQSPIPDVPQPTCSKTDVKFATTATARKELGLMAPKRLAEANKELSLKEIKSRMSRSAKLAEMRESLAMINRGNEKLRDIELRKAEHDSMNPKLGKFRTINMEVTSPMKACPSPVKISSPSKCSPMKAPAYQRFSSLAVSGPPTLTLPFKHRCLAEVFRCVDTVVALMHNRKEVVTFGKLKPAVQQMLRRNLGESHLGQIKRVLPSAYAFSQDKCHTFGSTARADRYELTITPLVDPPATASAPLVTPSTLIERRQAFTDQLMERVQEAHEQFLLALDPPLVIARDRLTRWHPEFDLEEVEEVTPDALPLPPNAEHFSTAGDVLAKAKNLFSCNERMERALQQLSQMQSSSQPPPSPSKVSVPAIPAAALRGIPKALLDKVRATQAAKALVAMSRSEEQDREGTQHSRLPELARIIRNVYVAEKKGVLPLELAIARIGNSFRENLTPADLEEHVQLLIESVPGWLQIHEIRKAKFLKIAKNGDMAQVMRKLEALAVEKNGA